MWTLDAEIKVNRKITSEHGVGALKMLKELEICLQIDNERF